VFLLLLKRVGELTPGERATAPRAHSQRVCFTSEQACTLILRHNNKTINAPFIFTSDAAVRSFA
jgi:hypothetical protein